MERGNVTTFGSRQYMLNEQYEIFYFEDANPNHVLAHHHDYYELYFFIEGTVDYEINGRLHPLQYGDFLFLPPGVPHRPRFTSFGTPYKRFVLWVSGSFMQELTSRWKDMGYCLTHTCEQEKYRIRVDSVTFQELQSRLILLIEESRSDRFCHEVEARLLIASFLVFINRIVYKEMHQQEQTVEKELYLNLSTYISGHLQENLSLDKLSALFYVSKYHISHIFKERMGISLHQFIIKKRLQASRNAILSGTPISKASQQSGFCDYTSFYRAFRKEYGISPKEFIAFHKAN